MIRAIFFLACIGCAHSSSVLMAEENTISVKTESRSVVFLDESENLIGTHLLIFRFA
jgi:hypothetical protein